MGGGNVHDLEMFKLLYYSPRKRGWRRERCVIPGRNESQTERRETGAERGWILLHKRNLFLPWSILLKQILAESATRKKTAQKDEASASSVDI